MSEEVKSVGIAFIWNEQILLVNHPKSKKFKGSLSIPKGRVDAKDIGIDYFTAIREVKEEIGLRVPVNWMTHNEIFSVFNSEGREISYYIVEINRLSDLGMKAPIVCPLQYQKEEVAWGGFMPFSEAWDNILKYQRPILLKAGYIPDDSFYSGGDVKDGSKIEMEHKETLEKLSSGKYSVEEGAEMIAKDHLEERDDYYDVIKRVNLKEGGSVNDFADEKRSEIENYVKENLGFVPKFNKSVTDYGISLYIGNIRISDHSVTNTHRVLNEKHYSLRNGSKNNWKTKKFLEDVEEVYYPERFKEIRVDKVVSKKSSDTAKDLEDFKLRHAHQFNVRNIETEKYTNKKGVERINVKYDYDVKFSVLETVRVEDGSFSEGGKVEEVTKELKASCVETGKPIKFNYLHTKNKEKTQDFGATFGQNIEPSGKYIVSVPKSSFRLEDNDRASYEYGVITFYNPLVVEFKSTDDKGWKKDLYDKYKKKGKSLSKAIKKDGYDGIITVNSDNGYAVEIVSLSNKMEKGGKVPFVHSKKGDIKLSLENHWYDGDFTKVQLVPVSELIKFREFDRTVTPKWNQDESNKTIGILSSSYLDEGIKEPLIIEYSVEDNSVLLVEGNHRLNSAIDLGIDFLPARVVLRKTPFTKDKKEHSLVVVGKGADRSGYISSDLSPSEVGITHTEPIYEKGGVIEGQLHSECNEPHGCGRKFDVGNSGKVIEAERDEAVIVSSAFNSNEELTIKGTPSEIASALNVNGGGKQFDKGAETKDSNGKDLKSVDNKTTDSNTDVEDDLEGGSVIINRRSMADEKEYEVKGTARQIASAINSIDGNGVEIEGGAEIKGK